MEYKILHLSDLHLSKKPNAKRHQLNLFKPLKGMNENFSKLICKDVFKNADLIIFTGDITDHGDIEAWEFFWNQLKKNDLLEKTLVVPGNHDVGFFGIMNARKKKKDRDRYFMTAKAGLLLGNQQIKFPWISQPNKKIIIFGLNSNNTGNLNTLDNAIGRLDYFQLKTFALKLHIYREVPIKIVVLHHSPNIPENDTLKKRGNKSISKLERLGLQMDKANRRSFILLCIAHHVRLIAHGHIHDAEDRRITSVRIIGAPAFTEPTKKDRKYHFYSYCIKNKIVRAQLQGIEI